MLVLSRLRKHMAVQHHPRPSFQSTIKYSYPDKIMRSLLVFVSLLSLTTASHVSRSAPDTDGEYSWDCGHVGYFSTISEYFRFTYIQ